MDRIGGLSFYLDLLQTLDLLGIPYVVIGAFAGASYGVTRATVDVDIVVHLDEAGIEALAAAYPEPRYYADPEQMRDSVQRGIMFNIIDSAEGRKVDLIPLTMPPGYAWALQGRVRRAIVLASGERVEAWFARPEDIIIGKLMAWREGRSAKHPSDIRDILTAVRLGEDPELTADFHIEDIDQRAASLGADVQALWDALKAACGLSAP